MIIEKLHALLNGYHKMRESGPNSIFHATDKEIAVQEALIADTLGMLVRETWIAWANEQPDISEHPHWLTPWADLAERDKDVDRRIGMVIWNAVRHQ